DWDLQGGSHFSEHAAEDIIKSIRARNKNLPIFLIAEKTLVGDLPTEVIKEVHEYVYMYQDTAAFIAGRVDFAVRRYYEALLPPYFRELKNFTEDAAYSWDAPGHMGGVAYLKHPVGMEFHKFFGENIMRADIGISTVELGDWLEHIGPSYESECNAARIFGAEYTFYVLGGSSTSNRIVCQGAIGAGEMVVVDRNCHKSLNHGLTISGARAVYLKPTRNGYGMIGLIPPSWFEPEYIRKVIEESPLATDAISSDPSYAVVTNCTYDGFCYDIDRVVELLGKSVPRIHFDEAWYAYAKFHPLYRGRFSMGVPANDNLPTLFAVQSTHKMLPAFSMASMIHLRVNPKRAPLEFDQFNEAFMIHGTTSPFYPMIASIDVATSMMDEPAGPTMMQETVLDAIGLRKAIASVARKLAVEGEQNSWFFSCYQPEKVSDPRTEEQFNFVDAPDELLANESSCWTLKPGDRWHGFEDDCLDENYCMLDPTKVTIICPGISPNGQISDWGIPGAILTRFLDSRRIEIARTGDYTVLVLFSVGSSKGKWGTLLESLIEFKCLYDSGATVYEVLPDLVAEYPESYSWNENNKPMTLKDLCQTMHEEMSKLNLPGLLNEACDTIPDTVLSSAETYQKLVRGKTEKLKVEEVENRVSGHLLVPYPPGIPILMPGERLGTKDSPHIKFLLNLQEFSQRFPGFEHEIHGIEVDEEGVFWMRCVKKEIRETEEIIREKKEKRTFTSTLIRRQMARSHSVMRSFKKGRS
ncbi:MAG TPA: Orn/Lys/Arg decarboxylase N-terminal domain-containing protein, partial [Methanosarcina sp.]